VAQAGLPGRGAAILTLGILSLVMLGLFTGIPAWVMGRRDLRRIRSGEIAAAEENFTKAGMIMGLVGTCISIVWVILGLILVFSVFNHGRWSRPYRVESIREKMLVELRVIANDAVAYRTSQDEETFVGYAIPDHLRSTATAEYSEGAATSVVISFFGEANDGTATVEVSVDAEGKIVGVHFGEGQGEEGSDALDMQVSAAPLPMGI
jgi:hypothetical protein